jgi:polygalacturonase
VPPGHYLTGAHFLRSHTELHLAAGATLVASQEPRHFPPFKGWHADEMIRKARVDAKLPREAENPEGAALKWPRPRAINLIRCRRVTVADL